MRKVINRTGKNKGQVECIQSVWSDRELQTFIDVCEQLNLDSNLDKLTEEKEVSFVKAFVPSFDETQQIATIQSEVDRSNGFTTYLIEIWQFG